MKSTTLLGMLLLVSIATVAQAATPTVILGITTSGNTWSLYAVGSPGCPSLQGFDVSFGGSGQAQVTSSSRWLPGLSNWYPCGSVAGGIVSNLGISNNGLDNDPTYLSTPVLLAKGTFTGPAAFAAVSCLGNVSDESPYLAQGAVWEFQSGGSFPFPTGAAPSLFYDNSDANLDGKVDFHDYEVLESNFGKTNATWAMGDATGDQKVDFQDYLALELSFGQTGVECPITYSPFNFTHPGLPELIMFQRDLYRSVPTGTGGDYDGDGYVGFKDYIAFENATFGTSGIIVFGQPAPEPATVALLLAGVGLLLRRQRTQK